MTDMDYVEWLEYGIENGWIGPAVCFTHDGIPTSSAEDEEFDEGCDTCLFGHRIYDNAEHKAEVEANHAPSIWRQ